LARNLNFIALINAGRNSSDFAQVATITIIKKLVAAARFNHRRGIAKTLNHRIRDSKCCGIHNILNDCTGGGRSRSGGIDARTSIPKLLLALAVKNCFNLSFAEIEAALGCTVKFVKAIVGHTFDSLGMYAKAHYARQGNG
jgi:hypothetical protein